MSADLAHVSLLDWGLLLVLLVSVLIGLWRGLVFELASLAAWVLAWWAAHQFGDAVGARLPLGGWSDGARHVAGFAAAFALTLVVAGLAARLMRIAISFTPLTLPDRLLGAIFGLARGVLVLLIATTLVLWTPMRDAGWWQEARGAQWLTALHHSLQPLLPSLWQGAAPT